MSRPVTRPAFATIWVLALLGLVTTALAGLVVVSRLEHLQAKSAVTQAQLRQVVLAATFDATARSAGWGPSPPPQQWTTTFPGGTFSAKSGIATAAANEVRVQITASTGEHGMSQSLRYQRANQTWHLIEIRSEPD